MMLNDKKQTIDTRRRALEADTMSATTSATARPVKTRVFARSSDARRRWTTTTRAMASRHATVVLDKCHRKTTTVSSSRRLARSTTRSSTRAYASDASVASVTESATESASSESFDWFQAWYPLRPTSFLDADEPNEVRVLGKKLVAYLDKTRGEWCVLEDSCPHRRAPLSLGYVQKDGALACRYHGWAFDGKDGTCVSIPMSVDETAEKTACASPRSCAQSFPCRVEDGILWVWPTSGADATLKSAGTPCATSLAEEGTLPGEWGMVELPVGYAPALENQFDPSHAEWLHAKYDEEGQLSDKANAGFVAMTKFNVREGTMNKDGFVVDHGGYNKSNADVSASRVFTAPCSSRSEYVDAKGKKYLSAAILYTPTEPGRTLMFTKFQAHQSGAVQGAGAKKVTPADRLNSLVSAPAKSLFDFYIDNFTSDPALVRVGLSHGTPPGSSAYNLGDQDILAMHGVEVEMESLDKPWKQSYYLPTPADAGVSTFRSWMDKHAGGRVAWARGVVDDASKVKSEAEQLDRYHRHTKHCVACKTALAELGKLEERCVLASKYLLAGGLFLAVTGAAFDQQAPATISACLAGASLVGAEMVRDMQHEFVSSVPRRGVPKPKLW